MTSPSIGKRVKYWLGSYLPGRRGARYTRKLRKLDAPAAEAAFAEALRATAGGIAVDLGANLGTYARQMARTAARVYAFEPDPWTAQTLRTNLADLDNVTIIEAAAGATAGTFQLYRAPGFETDPDKWSESSSLVAEKLNIDAGKGIDVEVIDFAAFLQDLNAPVGVIKIDIEGAEVDLMERLLDHPVLSRIGHIFVETHEDRIPTLAARTKALRQRAKAQVKPVINMDWR